MNELNRENNIPLDLDFKDDPDAPKWPNNGIGFNRWFTGLHAFIYALQYRFNPYKNPLGMKAKYVNIRIDTRNGHFIVFTEDENRECKRRTTPDELGLIFEPVEIGPERQDSI